MSCAQEVRRALFESMRGFLIAIVLAMLPFAARGQEPEPERCFDVAVVARLVRETPGPIPDLGSDVIVMRWPWVLEFEIEEIAIGEEDRRRLSVSASLHAGFSSQVRHFLLFLRRDLELGYVAEDIVVTVLRDRRGRFVIPVDGPIGDDELRPSGWVPASYESYLRPIRYRGRDAWWLSEPYLDYLAEAPHGWRTLSDGRAIALRGFHVNELERMMRQHPGAICNQ